MAKKPEFEPDWKEDAPVEGSYRSIFKWGNPLGFKHPSARLYEQLKETFNLTDSDFKEKQFEGNELVNYKKTVKLSKAQIKKFAAIVGEENISFDNYDRLKFATGKTLEEAMYLRREIIDAVADLVVHPRHKEDVQLIVKYCNQQKIPIYVYGGGSSVNFGLKPAKGGITLVMSTHMNKVLEINERDQTAVVQAGMMGPAYEDVLNNAPEQFNTRLRYTCGHFPQSFEYSSVGGWIVTLGSGQQSSYYGDAYDIVLSQEYITPNGIISTLDYPATATGPKINDIMKGSEGTYGVLVELKMKIFRHTPQNRQYFSFLFPSWEDAVNAGREISQGEFGMPAVFRLLDHEETQFAFKLYGFDGSIIDKFFALRGFKPGKKCLFLGSADGEKGFTKNIKKNVKKICKKHGGLNLSGYPTRHWEPDRYKHPYLREDLQDFGILSDTLETSVTWDNLHTVYNEVMAYMKSFPHTINMAHGSHFYAQGTNLYFIYFLKTDDVKEYIKFQYGIIDTIQKSGGSLSHHHGVGRMIGPWMEEHLGKEQMGLLRTIKKHFDPNNIMNPGGQMGLDTAGKNRRKIK
ncbi:MAG: FAD-binding oxidoreductase [bacterium]|nr:FAD-binding oxidoreductase [bacterium]